MLKNIIVKNGFMKKKITAIFPDNIERPVKGQECKLTVVSIILCVFFTSA